MTKVSRGRRWGSDRRFQKLPELSGIKPTTRDVKWNTRWRSVRWSTQRHDSRHRRSRQSETPPSDNTQMLDVNKNIYKHKKRIYNCIMEIKKKKKTDLFEFVRSENLQPDSWSQKKVEPKVTWGTFFYFFYYLSLWPLTSAFNPSIKWSVWGTVPYSGHISDNLAVSHHWPKYVCFVFLN